MSNERQVEQTHKKIFKDLVCCSSGCEIAPVYERVYNDKLHRNVVEKVDETNIYEFIQASKSSTDLAALEKRFLATGEIPAVDPAMTGDGIDFTQMPRDIHEVYAFINDMDNSFSKLPESVQKIFGSKEAYMQSVINGTTQVTILAAIKNQGAQTPKENPKEVNENE